MRTTKYKIPKTVYILRHIGEDIIVYPILWYEGKEKEEKRKGRKGEGKGREEKGSNRTQKTETGRIIVERNGDMGPTQIYRDIH